MNRRFDVRIEGDSRLESRIESYELAARMQLGAPEALDIASETAATRRLYGLEEPATADFGRRCLLARRLLERGVRFVQVWSGAGGPSNNWDNHSDIPKELPKIARLVDQPAAALLNDLKARGLLEDTLVLWSTEFGRMPFTQGATGRDHNGGTSVAWLAGGEVKAGTAHGESDPWSSYKGRLVAAYRQTWTFGREREAPSFPKASRFPMRVASWIESTPVSPWSWRAVKDATTGYDLHATTLHLLGIDHERLSVRHDGIDRRLADVHGKVIREILA